MPSILKSSKLKNQKGSILVTVLTFCLIMIIGASGYLLVIVNKLQIENQNSKNMYALHAAESGAVMAAAILKNRVPAYTNSVPLLIDKQWTDYMLVTVIDSVGTDRWIVSRAYDAGSFDKSMASAGPLLKVIRWKLVIVPGKDTRLTDRVED